jgi:Beta-propeller repeat
MRALTFLFALAACDLIAASPSFHLDYATYLGGSLDEGSSGIAVDSSGNAYLVGTTSSLDFPLTSTAFGVPSKDHGCAFVTKLNAAGTSVVWSVCIADAAGDGIAVGPDGSVFVLTHTVNGSLVSKLSPDANRIVYAKALGATAAGMAVDTQGNVYVTGAAGPGFATTEGAYQRQAHPGVCNEGSGIGSTPFPCPDAVVMKFRPDGQVAYSTYLGGSGPDQARAVAVDSQGNAWITGDTTSADFPITPGAGKSAFQGEVDLGPLRFGDAFVAKLNPTGSSLLYSTYLGGEAPDAGFAIAVDGAGAAYVTGSTQSADFPTTPGALQRTYGGGNPQPALAGDAFVVKFSASGAIAYATFLGGPQAERGIAIAVNGQGDAYVNVNSNTSALNPNTVSILNPGGSAIVNSAAVNGWFALDGEGSLYFTGITSGDLFFPTAGAFQTTFGGGTFDTTVVKIDFDGAASAWIANIVNAAGLRSGTPANYPVFSGTGRNYHDLWERLRQQYASAV